MNLKNYTTEILAAKSINSIEALLINFGATNIMKEYNKGQCAAISFMIEMDGMKLPFQLPARTEKIFKWLKKSRPKTKDQTLIDQAYRIAWKQQYEWLHLQLSMIEIEMAEKLELFFPYLYDIKHNETYYDKVKANGFKALITNG